MRDMRVLFKALRTDLGKFARMDWRVRADLVRATAELFIARVKLGSKEVGEMVAALEATTEARGRLARERSEIIDRVAFAIPRSASRVPFRSDCLVQALAAQRWLARFGIPARLTFGVMPQRTGDFEAHAWLEASGRVVTGGDISSYRPFSRPPAVS
jgi:hypothetical protein